MKKVVSNRDVPHLWAHQTQAEARNAKSSLYFEGDTIYSYGSHFPIARHVSNSQNEHAVLFTTRSYSITTSHHVSRTRSAIPYGTRIFYVYDPSRSPREILEREFPSAIRSNLESAAVANRRNRPKYLASAQETLQRAQEFAAFFGLDASTLPVLPDAENVTRVVSEWKEAERKAAEERNRKQARRAEAQRREALKKFRAGSNHTYARLKDGSAALRIDGNEVVTSLGATFPIEHARLGLRAVRRVMQSGVEYARNEHTIHLGHYAIDRIEVNGTVHAGCHVVNFEEIARIADALESKQ